MKVQERNNLIAECVSRYQQVHDKYFPRGKPLEDPEYEDCIHEMDAIALEYKKTIPNISGTICMAYLDDIQEYHEKWKDYLKNEGSDL